MLYCYPEAGKAMERLLMQDLIAWKANQDRKPLVVKGVGQCGVDFQVNLTRFCFNYDYKRHTPC